MYVKSSNSFSIKQALDEENPEEIYKIIPKLTFNKNCKSTIYIYIIIISRYPLLSFNEKSTDKIHCISINLNQYKLILLL